LSTSLSTRLTKKLATEWMAEMSFPAFTRSSSPRMYASITLAYASIANSRVMLTLMPAAIVRSTALAPSTVPGILIITFGRLTVAHSRSASDTVARMSFAAPGDTSIETNPSSPFD